jgi:hypothetical protein
MAYVASAQARTDTEQCGEPRLGRIVLGAVGFREGVRGSREGSAHSGFL